jgi:3',5'-cyclic AMP phosphodiesterase CpdA
MKTIVHISDLHFGRVEETLLDPLVQAIDAVAPHVVAISGDLTQRARKREFEAAANFLQRLRYPQVVVPGNHDVPLYNVAARFLRPLTNYTKYITTDLAPSYRDEELVVLGINTARSLTWKGGRINEEQLADARAQLCAVGRDVMKVVVTHHPFDVEPGSGEEVVGRASLAMESLAKCGVDILLAGHFHKATTNTTAHRFCIAGHAALAVQSGTTLSERTRSEANSFNVLRTEPRHVMVERHVWDAGTGRFVAQHHEEFREDGEAWREVGTDAAH